MATNKNNGIFSRLFGTRFIVTRNGAQIVNLSLLYCLIAAMAAPWLFVGSLIAALVLGYKFGCERNAADFGDSFDEVVREAKDNVRSAVDSIKGSSHQG